MWLGIFAALLLCLATAVAYAEISKLYPGTGSSYYYAEQALLSKDKAFKYARVAKFIVGWGSHLYYWVYPGVMVATTGIFVGYVVGFLYPNFISGCNPGPIFMALVAVIFSFFVAWIASEGRRRINGREPRHQHRADFRADRFQRAGTWLSRQPSFRHTPDSSTTRKRSRHLHLSVRDRQRRLDHSRCRAATRCRCWTQPASRFLTDHLSQHGRERQLPYPPQRRFGGCSRTRSATCSFRPRSPF